MIRPAQLYKDRLLALDIEKCYGNLFYQYYYGDSDIYTPLNIDNNNACHFVSVDKDDNIIGYISYTIDRYSNNAKWWGVKSYTPSVIFAKDCLQAVDDVFCKYNLNRIEWSCYADNPAIRGYTKFIKKCGGIQCGRLHKERMLIDGKLHDTIIFEIMREDYLKSKEKEQNDR